MLTNPFSSTNSSDSAQTQSLKTERRCRFCTSSLGEPFLDLGTQPLANSYLRIEDVAFEQEHPLRVFLCPSCSLVQLSDYEAAENIFSDNYAYFSSYSESWLRHAKDYTDIVTERFSLNPASFVIEIASNDGYLLQYFKQKGIPVLGVEPTGNTARVAIDKGIPTLVKFFGEQTARDLAAEGKNADLLLGNNVLAHVPQLNDFVKGMKIILKPEGVITMEFPHLLQLVEQNQFDTIYHEHFSYYSCSVVEKVFAAQGLTLFDVEELPTHGGSLRIYVRHTENTSLPVTERMGALKKREADAGLFGKERYQEFTKKVEKVKLGLLAFLEKAHAEGKTVACYGAPAKGNTLLNYCGVTAEDVTFTVDRSPHKQNLLLPGSHIPIDSPERVKRDKPDYLLILPWNLKDEIAGQMSFIREWGGKFVVPIPEIRVW